MSSDLTLKKKIVFIMIPIVIFLGVMEIGLRKFGNFAPARDVCYHPVMGSSYCPDTRRKRVINSVAGWYGANSDGLMDKEYSAERVPGTVRIAVMGDSFVSAEGVSQEYHFHNLWEKWLPEKLGKPVEVISFGVRGTGTWQQLHMFNLKVKKYKPDLTILAFCWCNDISNNVDQFKSGNPNPLLNEFETDSFLQNIQVKRKNFNKWLWNHSALYQLSKDRYNHLELTIKNYFRPEYMKLSWKRKEFENKNNGKAENLFRTSPYPFITKVSLGSEGRVSELGPPPDEIPKDKKDSTSMVDDLFFFNSEGWQITKKLILKFNADAKSIGSDFLVLQLVGAFRAKNYPDLPDKSLTWFLKKENIKSLNLYEYFKNLEDGEFSPNFIPNDMHFSKKGHETFAKVTVDFLVEALKSSPNKNQL